MPIEQAERIAQSQFAWTVEGILSDSFTTATFRAVIPTAAVTYAYDKEGRFAVGTVPDRGKPNSLIVAGDIYVGGKLLIDIFYPVGTIYESTSSANPSTFMGGSWERFANGKVLIGVSENETEFNTVNKIGGEKTHVLTTSELPSFNLTVPMNAVGGGTATNFNDGVNAGVRSKVNNYTKYVPTTAIGSNTPHNNLQPYVTIYRWRRIA